MVAHTESVVWVRYVRRELRSLSDTDRDAYLDAMEVIFKEDCTLGKSMYGDSWACIDEFTRMHANYAGDPECDHMHDGYGFLTQHAGLSMWFEQALQAVNPSVTLPYWDYTIEQHAVHMAMGDARVWRESVVFSETWFGEANTKAENLNAVSNGRFAYTSVRLNSANFSSYNNAYGMMRAPWNNNNVPYVTRSNSSYGFTLTDMPSCAYHYNLLAETTFEDFGKDSMYSPHGPTHLAIGGTWGADWKSYLLEWDYNLLYAYRWGIGGFSKQKNMFRAGWMHCPEYCGMDTPQAMCKCSCGDKDTQALKESKLNMLFMGQDWLLQSNNGTSLANNIFDLLCNNLNDTAAVMGDSLEAASPNDVSFWPTHPTVDRLLQWKRINGFESEDWPDDSAWSVYGMSTGYCWGHNKNDVLFYTNLFDNEAGPYSNADLWSLLDPKNPKSPYIYDTFEWPHCVDEGYTIDLMEQVGLPDGNVRASRIPVNVER